MKLRRRRQERWGGSETMRGERRCEARHPVWGCVRCERTESDHVTHHADGRTFEWIHFLPVRIGYEHRA